MKDKFEGAYCIQNYHGDDIRHTFNITPDKHERS